MEELHERIQVGRKDVTEASSRSDQPLIAAEEAEKLSIVVQVELTSGLTSSREELFRSILDAEDVRAIQSKTSNTRIQKVPDILRGNKPQDFSKYFEPMVVSIGPYHHGKHELRLAETLKLKFAKEFIKDSGQPIEVLHNKIFKKIKRLRDRYDEEPTKSYSDEALAWMLFVDGCFLLHFIHCLVNSELEDLNIKHHDVAFVPQDLLLLENQLPFQVLRKLMSSRFKDDEAKKMIKDFIGMNINPPHRQEEPQVKKENPSHLLELLREALIGEPKQTRQRVGEALRGKEDKKNNHWPSFRNVTELSAAGIRLKASDASCVTGVSFRSYFFCADLKLPRIMVDDSMGSKFMNLIAYEMCPGVVNNLEVTSYICFLDSLIDHPNDVKELREKHILWNFLGSDKEVAKLFNKIGNDLVPNNDIYRDVKTSIQSHFDSKCNTWIAKGYNEHFSTPWTIIAFIAALLAILLSLVQTYYTIYPRPEFGYGKKPI